jgi:hypothetical protein
MLPPFGFAVLMAVAACTTSQDGDAAETSEATSPTAAASPTLVPEQIEDPLDAGVAAYQRYWDTITAELAAPDGDFTAFTEVASGQALEYAQSIEQRGVDDQVHGSGAFTHDIEIKDSLITNESMQVVVTDCSDSSGTQVLDANNEPVVGEEYGPKHIEARVEQIDEKWLVTVIAVQEIGSCVPDDS